MAVNLIDGTSTTIEESGNDIKVEINLPVGFIYMSTNSTDPSTYFGGTWQRIAKGRTLVGVDETDTDFDQPGETGGEKEHLQTQLECYWTTQGSNPTGSGGTGGYLVGHSSQNQQPFNIMQPYFTCYIWEKVS